MSAYAGEFKSGRPENFERKLRGANLIQPEAKQDWAKGGCSGAKSQRVHCAGAQAPKSTNPEGFLQSAGAGVWGATSRRQFKLSGRQKNGYYFKFIRAVAQLGSALVSGTRGPGFKSRRPDEFAVGGTPSD